MEPGNLDAAVVFLLSKLSNAEAGVISRFSSWQLLNVCLRRPMKVCSVQEHLELGGSEMKVHQIAINHQPFPLLGPFAVVLKGSSREAPVCGEVLAPWCSAANCPSCSTKCVIEKLFDFPSFHKHCAFCSAASKAGSFGTMGVCRSPAGTKLYLGKGTWKNRESSQLNNTIGLIRNLCSEIHTLAQSPRAI